MGKIGRKPKRIEVLPAGPERAPQREPVPAPAEPVRVPTPQPAQP